MNNKDHHDGDDNNDHSNSTNNKNHHYLRKDEDINESPKGQSNFKKSSFSEALSITMI